MKKWCVVQTKQFKETIAEYELRNQKFDVYLPMYQVIAQNRKGEKLLKSKPLFPSYLFIAINKDTYFRSINGTRGVSCLVDCTEDHFSYLPSGWVEDFREQLENSPPEDAVAEMIKFVENMQVEVTDGTLKGHVGTFLHSSHKKVTLLLTLLGRQSRVIFSMRSVQPRRDEGR